jgi:hypothetical protein
MRKEIVDPDQLLVATILKSISLVCNLIRVAFCVSDKHSIPIKCAGESEVP